MTKAYPSNLTWEQWELIAQEFPLYGKFSQNKAIAQLENREWNILLVGIDFL